MVIELGHNLTTTRRSDHMYCSTPLNEENHLTWTWKHVTLPVDEAKIHQQQPELALQCKMRHFNA